MESDIGQDYVDWLNDSQVNQYVQFRHHQNTIESIIEYINSVRCNPHQETFAIVTKKKRRFVGTISVPIFNQNNQGVAYYGVMVGENIYRNTGVGFEAQLLTLKWLFSFSQIRRVGGGGVVSSNIGSIRIKEAIGFVREGVLRQTEVLADGSICDVWQYGMLRQEWKEAETKWEKILKHYEVLPFEKPNR